MPNAKTEWLTCLFVPQRHSPYSLSVMHHFMRQIFIITFIFCFSGLKSQELFDNLKDVQEVNFFYKDSANNEIAYGKYEPTSLIGLKNGSLIISTEFSITFPSQYKTPTDFNKEYFEKQKVYYEKAHTSSGSILKLNEKLEKEWEIIFKDKRVNEIKLCNDNTIIAVGEKVEMNKFWVASVSLDGKMLWEKEFRNKMETTVSDLILDSLNNIYILLESERLIPIQNRKLEFGQRRLEFFRIAEMDNDLYITKVSQTGKRQWTTALDKRKKFDTFGYNLVQSNDKIYASSHYEGFKKRRKEWKKYEGKNIFEISSRGRVLNSYESPNNRLLFQDNGLISCTPANNDTLQVFRNAYQNQKELNTIILPSEIEHFWIKKGLNNISHKYLMGSTNHNLGYLLVELDNNYKFKGFWNNGGDHTCESVDFTVMEDGSLIIIGVKWKNIDGKSVRFINIKKLLKNGA